MGDEVPNHSDAAYYSDVPQHTAVAYSSDVPRRSLPDAKYEITNNYIWIAYIPPSSSTPTVQVYSHPHPIC